MQINYDYLKQLLEAFEAEKEPVTNIRNLEEAGFSNEDEQLIFHMSILYDQIFIEREDREPGFGFSRGADGHTAWSNVPLRLTAQGHEFLAGIRNKKIWNIVTEKLKAEGLGTVTAVVKELTTKAAMQLASLI